VRRRTGSFADSSGIEVIDRFICLGLGPGSQVLDIDEGSALLLLQPFEDFSRSRIVQIGVSG
jgi:hypothetical protein